jgi:hypothetical protein
LGIGDWAQSPIPNPQSPIPNPHKNNKNNKLIILSEINFIFNKIINIINYSICRGAYIIFSLFNLFIKEFNIISYCSLISFAFFYFLGFLLFIISS